MVRYTANLTRDIHRPLKFSFSVALSSLILYSANSIFLLLLSLSTASPNTRESTILWMDFSLLSQPRCGNSWQKDGAIVGFNLLVCQLSGILVLQCLMSIFLKPLFDVFFLLWFGYFRQNGVPGTHTPSCLEVKVVCVDVCVCSFQLLDYA